MPIEIIKWTWEEAFQKFGFGDGDAEVHTGLIEHVLEEMGYDYTDVDGIHNPYIVEVSKDGKTWETDSYAENDGIRDSLPKDVIKRLDQDFPEDSIWPNGENNAGQ